MRRLERKRIMALILGLALAFPCLNASAAETENRLEIAFGLFSVALPEGVTARPDANHMLSDCKFETDGAPRIIYVNFAPIEDYEVTAQKSLNGIVSMVFALCGGNYSETETQEETLENGVRLRWQLMRGDSLHALWFEAFDDLYGFNMCMDCNAKEADDDALLAVMRSFRVDTELERDLTEVRQTKLPDGSFISAEHGLKIQLTDEWNVVPYEELLQPGSAFVLEKGGGRWMIQLFCAHPGDETYTSEFLAWLLENQAVTDAAGEPFRIELENLGTEALVAEVDANVTMLNVAFAHEGFIYYGLFMWVNMDEEEARPFMMEALRTIRPAGE